MARAVESPSAGPKLTAAPMARPSAKLCTASPSRIISAIGRRPPSLHICLLPSCPFLNLTEANDGVLEGLGGGQGRQGAHGDDAVGWERGGGREGPVDIRVLVACRALQSSSQPSPMTSLRCELTTSRALGSWETKVEMDSSM